MSVIEIKNKYAISRGYENWDEYFWKDDISDNDINDLLELCKDSILRDSVKINKN